MTYLPDPGQISQVEDVVELGGRGQHLDLDLLPALARGQNEARDCLHDFFGESTLLCTVDRNEMKFNHMVIPWKDGKYLIDGYLLSTTK